jgi:hypothetical protein
MQERQTEPHPEAVAEALARVYARPEFTERALPGPLQLLADAWAAFRVWLGSVVGEGIEAVAAVPLLRVAVLVLFALLVYLLARLLVRSQLDRLGRRSPAAHGGGGGGLGGLASEPGDSAGWNALAGRAASEGRLRDAALALYQAVVHGLGEAGLVRVHEGKTPGDYRREVRARPGAAAAFESFLRVLLPLAFGSRPPDEPAYLQLRDAAAGVGSVVQDPEPGQSAQAERDARPETHAAGEGDAEPA